MQMKTNDYHHREALQAGAVSLPRRPRSEAPHPEVATTSTAQAQRHQAQCRPVLTCPHHLREGLQEARQEGEIARIEAGTKNLPRLPWKDHNLDEIGLYFSFTVDKDLLLFFVYRCNHLALYPEPFSLCWRQRVGEFSS